MLTCPFCGNQMCTCSKPPQCVCGKPIGDSPSDLFCSERCQFLWWWEQSGRANPDLVERVAELDAQITGMMERHDQRAVLAR